MLEQQNPPTREQGTDSPGRFASPDRVSRSAVEQTDWHQLAEDRFAHEISSALYRMAHANAFRELILVAPPKVLGTLRESLHKEVAQRILAEIPKDLTTHPVRDIGRLLASSSH
jgi:protein required for attachment to host cells